MRVKKRMSTKRREDMIDVLVIRVSLCPHPINVPRAQTLFLEEEHHRREGLIPSLKMRFRKLSGRKNDKGY